MSPTPLLILGGTFDPIHFGHLNPAREVLDMTGFDQLRLVPASNPPHRKPPVASAEHRLAMTRLGAATDPRFQVDDREYRVDQPSWTINTLRSFRTEFPERPLALLIGEDSLHSFTTWKQWEELPELAHIVAMRRPGEQKTLPTWASERAIADPDMLKEQKSGHFLFVEVSPNPVSATTLRARLKNGEDISGMTPDSVIEYIQQHKLYRNL